VYNEHMNFHAAVVEMLAKAIDYTLQSATRYHETKLSVMSSGV